MVSATAFDANDLLMTMLKDMLRLSSLLWLWLKLRLFPPNSDSATCCDEWARNHPHPQRAVLVEMLELSNIVMMKCNQRERLGLHDDVYRWLGQGFLRRRMRMKMSQQKHGNPQRHGKHGHFQVNLQHPR